MTAQRYEEHACLQSADQLAGDESQPFASLDASTEVADAILRIARDPYRCRCRHPLRIAGDAPTRSHGAILPVLGRQVDLDEVCNTRCTVRGLSGLDRGDVANRQPRG